MTVATFPSSRRAEKLGQIRPHRPQAIHKKLTQRLANPPVPAAKLFGLPDCYKIKLRSAGFRLVYRVFDDRIVVQVIAVGKRDKDEVYNDAAKRV